MIKIIIFLLCSSFTIFGQSNKALDNAIKGLTSSLEKRDFNLLKVHLDSTYTIGEIRRPKADKIIPQLIAQIPKLIGYKIEDSRHEKEIVVVTIEYETEGHLFGSNKATSKCFLTKEFKFIKIEYFDNIFDSAKKVTEH